MRCTVLILVAAVLIAGCGSNSETNSKMVRTGKPTPTVRADGTLSTNPAPLTLDDVERQPKTSAKRAVLKELFWIQWGSWPNIFDGYDPAIRSLVGAENLTGAMALQRGALVAAQFRIVSSRLINGRATVQVEMLTTTSPPSRESFVLRRSNGHWRIISDTLLERGLKAYVTQRVDGDAVGAKPSRRAARAGIEAAARYRGAFVRTKFSAERPARAAGATQTEDASSDGATPVEP